MLRDPVLPRLRVGLSSGRRDGPLLLLLHGLGATSDVWRPFASLLEQAVRGPTPRGWLALDLPGHGGSPPLPDYTVDALAAAVAADLASSGMADERSVVVLGHSLGGAVGLALSGREHPVAVTGVVGLGVKTVWSDDDVARGRALAGRPPAVLPDRAAALERHLRVAGLSGLAGPGDPAAGADVAVVEVGGAAGGWRLALDGAAFSVSLAGQAARLVAGARCPLLLVRGEHDPMTGPGDAAALGVPGQELAGLGHNAHVEDPAALLDAVRGTLLTW